VKRAIFLNKLYMFRVLTNNKSNNKNNCKYDRQNGENRSNLTQ